VGLGWGLALSGKTVPEDSKESDIASQSSETLLARAYGLKSPDQARALYRDWAETYDAHLENGLGYIAPAQIAAMLDEALEDRAVRILDVGCGTGLVGERLAALGFSSIDGLDFSPQMLAAAAEKDIYHELLESDLEGTLGIADAIYDAGISCGTFTHGHVGPGALTEIFRVLRSGAVFACTIHTHLWAEAGFAQHIAALEADGIIIVENIVDKPYFEAAEPDGKFCLMRKL